MEPPFPLDHVPSHQKFEPRIDFFAGGRGPDCLSAFDFLDTLSCDEQRILDESIYVLTLIELNMLVLNSKSKLELPSVAIGFYPEARFVARASWAGRLDDSQAKIMVKFNRTIDHPTCKLVEADPRTLRDP